SARSAPAAARRQAMRRRRAVAMQCRRAAAAAMRAPRRESQAAAAHSRAAATHSRRPEVRSRPAAAYSRRGRQSHPPLDGPSRRAEARAVALRAARRERGAERRSTTLTRRAARHVRRRRLRSIRIGGPPSGPPASNRVWLPKPILRLLLEPRCEAVGARQRDWNELERLTQPLVRLRAREAQEPAAGVTETLAAEARDAEIVVRSLEHEQCEAVARHSEAVAGGGDVG